VAAAPRRSEGWIGPPQARRQVFRRQTRVVAVARRKGTLDAAHAVLDELAEIAPEHAELGHEPTAGREDVEMREQEAVGPLALRRIGAPADHRRGLHRRIGELERRGAGVDGPERAEAGVDGEKRVLGRRHAGLLRARRRQSLRLLQGLGELLELPSHQRREAAPQAQPAPRAFEHLDEERVDFILRRRSAVTWAVGSRTTA
jgi:hypothetical protein